MSDNPHPTSAVIHRISEERESASAKAIATRFAPRTAPDEPIEPGIASALFESLTFAGTPRRLGRLAEAVRLRPAPKTHCGGPKLFGGGEPA
jgi:hypothetical protein